MNLAAHVPKASQLESLVASDGTAGLAGMAAKGKAFGTPGAAFCSRFMLLQVVIGLFFSFALPFTVSYLLLLEVEPYPWYTANLVGWVLGGVIISPTVSLLFAPLSLPEAVRNGWVRVVRVEDCHRLLLIFCGVGQHRFWRAACVRAAVIGLLLVLCIDVPVALLIAHWSFLDTLLTRWQGVWFNTLYAVAITPPVTALAVLSSVIEPNYARIEATMSDHPHALLRLFWRISECFVIFFDWRADVSVPSEVDVEKGDARDETTSSTASSATSPVMLSPPTAIRCSSPTKMILANCSSPVSRPRTVQHL